MRESKGRREKFEIEYLLRKVEASGERLLLTHMLGVVFPLKGMLSATCEFERVRCSWFWIDLQNANVIVRSNRVESVFVVMPMREESSARALLSGLMSLPQVVSSAHKPTTWSLSLRHIVRQQESLRLGCYERMPTTKKTQGGLQQTIPVL